jgi:hypothetical protein
VPVSTGVCDGVRKGTAGFALVMSLVLMGFILLLALSLSVFVWVEVVSENCNGWEVRHQQRVAPDTRGSFIFFIYPIGDDRDRLLSLRNPEGNS